MATAGGILSRLNASTGQFHADVDAPWLELLGPTVGISEYLGALVRMYGFVAPFESACKYAPGLARIVEFRQLMRAGFIAQDLLALDLSPSQVASIPTCPSITVFRTLQEAVGWLYVVERSTLLQDGIRRHLVRHVPQVERACAYLSSYEGRANEQWHAFSRILDRAGSDPEDADAIVDAALDAFDVAKQWFGSGKTDLRSVG